MRIIVGLGNYGDRYAYTYHNMGFLTVEYIADKLGIAFKKKECDSLTGTGRIGSEPVVLAKPLTYMNRSGQAVKQLLRKYKAELKDLIVIYDDIDIPKGSIRLRESGSAGSHNGMRDIVDCVGSGAFARVRVGIGRPPEYMDLAQFVLMNVPREDRELFVRAIEAAGDEMIITVKNGEAIHNRSIY